MNSSFTIFSVVLAAVLRFTCAVAGATTGAVTGEGVEISEVPAVTDVIPTPAVKVGIQDTAADDGKTPRP